MICIIDYGIGNLRSIEKAFEAVGAPVIRSDRPEDIDRADRVVLPGVGAFGACADEISRRNLIAPIKKAIADEKPFLGVCVGLQLLFAYSNEMGIHAGLDVIPGHVTRFRPSYVLEEAPVAGPEGIPAPEEEASLLKIPHMGWNTIRPVRASPLLEGLHAPSYFYFVHSYHAVAQNPEHVLAYTQYGDEFPSIVQRNNVYGVQFHPEKSHENGLRVLSNFAHIP